MKSVLHHLHLRKRGAHNTEPFPSKNAGIRLLDNVATAAGVIGPVMALPQIYQIYFLHNAAGVSALSWTAFGILNIPFILYGFVHKDRLILRTYILWCAVNLTVAFGAVFYGS
ncbi:hypothetical protein A3C20_02355 [Candidatus Kaiserbacteria bacterium RIFCSPHIGHO2_02_FULL_55_25]|uniref:Uncharacterized protein n=2 Tax=Parcubacteria group TaxID=1794811 RepID=A0A1F4Y0K7_9BACT|nr:MAG: hypothetical protein A3B33_02355 [Candidatus Adlerbacteria bacterium RIFCSPLOWO2_01_FULL_54_16]OGG54130.1 MAG: hypothetical protein A2764_00840 [Candidatus Kaiserbacteria bacterium RIFCSPHIGHO2_01_FULL_55_79]OGG69828.1 MAG: hypothetical protein A3C20_02355 [Candidatus Kaiserbacteria bacterium RIFCSPHIGHO2_02_FULL_55_25]OGG78462.1 MAG: hypothetical protein A3F56_04050 [Candidatus Kaiserbacteria bacterium RIFCSPHIGHO2_12_FULL_55_13]